MPLSKGEQLTQTLLEYNNLKNGLTKNKQTSLNRGSNLTNTLINNINNNINKTNNNNTNANVVERGFSTVGNVINQVIRGASKGLEGIYDFTANLVGGIGGLFGAKDFQQDVAEHTKFNWTDWWYNQSNMVETEQKAYTNDFVNGVAGSIGQMLPSIAIGVATGGASTAAQVASLGTFGVGAAGNAAETALNEGATPNQALGYGLLSGAKEVGTEIVGGKVLSGILGSTGRAFGVIGNRTTNQVAKTTGKELVKRFAKDAIEEGSEEALGDLLEPLIQMVYKDGSYAELFEENGGVQALLEDFAAGALTSGIMQGVSTGVNISQYGYTNYKLAQDIEILRNMQEQAQQEYFRGNNEAGDRILEERSNIIKRMQSDLIETLNRYQTANNYRKASITERIAQELAQQDAINTRSNIILEGLRNDITSNIGTTQENYSYYEPNTRKIVLRERDLSNIEKTKENLIHEYTHSVSNQNLIDTVINNMNEAEYQSKLETYTQRYANVIRQSSEYRNLLEQGYSINEAFNQVAENYVKEEIAADEMNKYFSNINEFKEAIKGSTKKGFSKLLNNIRALYRNKTKPSGYSEVVKLLQTNINRINKTAETKAKNKAIKEETKYKLDNEIAPSENNLPMENGTREITTPNEENIKIKAQELEDILPDAEYVYDLRKKKEKTTLKSLWGGLKMNWFNAQTHLEDSLAKKIKAKTLTLSDKAARYEAEVLVQRIRTAPKMAENFIERGLIDDNGNKILYGVEEIFKDLSQEDYIEFQDYMFHTHNIDRMSVEERIKPKRQEVIEQRKKDLEINEKALKAFKDKYGNFKNSNIPSNENQQIIDLQTSISNLKKEIDLRERAIKKIKNKPVFSSEYTADYSKKFIEKQLKVKDYATKFPELAQKIYDINNYILEESVKSGRLSTQERDLFKEYYPHYVPTYRPLKPQSANGMTNTGQDLFTKSYKQARGSNEPLIALDLQLKRYIMQNMKANTFNDLGTTLLYGEFQQPNRLVWETREDLPLLEENLNDDIKPIVEEKEGNFTLSILSNGVRVSRNIARDDFIGLQDMQSKFNIMSQVPDPVPRLLNKVMRMFKSSVTTLNPFFLVRNLARDVQDALIYTKYGTTNFIKMSKTALNEMYKRDTYFKLFRQYGGFSNSLFDSGESIYNSLDKSEVNNFKKKNPIKWLKNKMELANRAVEIFPRYVEFRLSIETQKKAGVKEIDYNKAIYDSQEVTLNFGKHGASKAAQALNRYVIPFFNAQLQGVSKIFKTITNADGKSVKAFSLLITKTILLGLIPAILNQLLYDDDEDYAKLSNYEKDNFYLFKIGDDFVKIPKGRIFALIGSFANNDNKKLNDYLSSAWDTLSPVASLRTIIDPIKNATTNTTWYGGNIVSQAYDNIRPSNQYDNTTSYIARGLGKVLNISPLKIDYVLEQYTGVIGDFVLPILTPKGLSNPKTTLLEPAINQFLIDPDSSSGYSSRFYNLTQELNYQTNEGNLQAKGQLKYLNKMKSYISDIYDEISNLEESNLSKKEIENQTKILRGSINALYKQAINTSEQIKKELDRYEINEDNYDKVYELALYSVLGAKSTMELTNPDLYDRATDLNEVGIDYDTYYTYYMNTKGFDKEYKEEYIQRMSLTRIQKYILYLVSGYAIPDNYKARLRKEIKNSNMSNEYKEKLLAKLE